MKSFFTFRSSGALASSSCGVLGMTLDNKDEKNNNENDGKKQHNILQCASTKCAENGVKAYVKSFSRIENTST